MPTDQIRADRACIGCGFNLFGQSVTKEDHYGLAIARCPECGTVAALQQYPAMTHWVNRFRMIIAAIYVLLLLAFFSASTMGISGFAFGASNIASENLRIHIQDHYSLWQDQQGNPQPTATGLPPGFNFASSNLTPKYIESELPGVIDSFGPLWSNKDSEWVIVMVPAVIVCFGIGVFWSVALLGASRKRATLVPLISCLIGGAFIIAANRPDYNNAWIWSLAHQLYIPTLVPVVILIEFLAISVGIWFGRTLARFAVRLALPPRARVPLSILWTRDGLELPRP
jgi:hypothetical protein